MLMLNLPSDVHMYNTITTLDHVVEFRELILTMNETANTDGFQYTASKRYK